MNKLTRLSTLTLAASLVLGGCSGAELPESDTQTSPSDTTVIEQPSYQFTKEYEGEEFHVLNIEDIYNMHGTIDTPEINGEMLNDTQYETCRTFEELTGVSFTESKVVLYDLRKTVTNTIAAGDDIYDAMYVNGYDYYTLSSEGYLYNLLEYEDIQLDKEWWIKASNDANTIGGKLYAADGYTQLMTVDAITCLIFNESMATDLGLAMPFQTIKDGKWTLDVFNSYIKQAGALNGDESFAWKADGKSRYGVAVGTVTEFLYGCGESFLKSENNVLTFTADSERFYNICDRIASMVDGVAEGMVYFGTGKSDDDSGGHVNCFESERALFAISEVCKTSRLREKNFAFSLLPYPKYDENQENYQSRKSFPASGAAIPVTASAPEFSAKMLDAMSYLFYNEVWPVFREYTLEQKQLRSDEAIEMLDIILESSFTWLLYSFDMYSVETAINNKLAAGESEVASVIASLKPSIEEKLESINS